jgi:hypothetical protein
MRRFLLLSLLISLPAMFGCQISHNELTSLQKQLAADLENITDDYLVFGEQEKLPNRAFDRRMSNTF